MNFKVTQKAQKTQKYFLSHAEFFLSPAEIKEITENRFHYEISIRLIRFNSL